MADNIAAKSDATTTLGTLAADDIGGVLYVRNKLVHGADGVNAGDVSTANPLPTVDSAGNTSLASIDGKITAVNTGAVVVSSSALPSGAATAAKQPALGTAGTPSADVISIQGVASGTVVPVSDGSGSLTVDNGGTFAVQAAQSGTWTVQPGNTANTTAWKVDASSVAVPITDNSGSLTIDAPVGTPAFVRLSDGAAAITTLPVSLASVPSHAVTNAGTFAVQATEADGANATLGSKADAKSTATDTTAVSAMSVLKQISASVQAPPSQAVTNAGTFAVQAAGDVASGSADSGNPVKNGMKVSTQLSALTLLSDAQRANMLCSEDGVQYVRHIPAHPADYFDASPTTITSSTADTSIQAAGSTGVRNYLTAIIIRNSSATNTGVILKDGSGGTSKAHIPVPANGGYTFRFDPPLRGSAATAWYAACQDSVASIYITPIGFKSKV